MTEIYESKYLTNEENIISYFHEEGSKFFECGQGYYDDFVSIDCKVREDYYTVDIEAEIGSAKQDIGDRVYFVVGIGNVSYEKWSTERVAKELSSKEMVQGDKLQHYKGGITIGEWKWDGEYLISTEERYIYGKGIYGYGDFIMKLSKEVTVEIKNNDWVDSNTKFKE